MNLLDCTTRFGHFQWQMMMIMIFTMEKTMINHGIVERGKTPLSCSEPHNSGLAAWPGASKLQWRFAGFSTVAYASIDSSVTHRTWKMVQVVWKICCQIQLAAENADVGIKSGVSHCQ